MRYEPMTNDRGRSYGVWDNRKSGWLTTSDRYRFEDDAKELADRLNAEQPLMDLLEIAWGVIANAGGGDWNKESKDWRDAAAKWRDEYHAALDKAKVH